MGLALVAASWGCSLVAECGLLNVVLSLARAQALRGIASVAVACGLSCFAHSMCGLSSLSRDQTRVPCVGRQILNHWTTTEVR